MAGINHGIVGKDEQAATDAFYQFVKIASGQVRPTDASLEENIARKHAMVSRTIEYQAAG